MERVHYSHGGAFRFDKVKGRRGYKLLALAADRGLTVEIDSETKESLEFGYVENLTVAHAVADAFETMESASGERLNWSSTDIVDELPQFLSVRSETAFEYMLRVRADIEKKLGTSTEWQRLYDRFGISSFREKAPDGYAYADRIGEGDYVRGKNTLPALVVDASIRLGKVTITAVVTWSDDTTTEEVTKVDRNSLIEIADPAELIVMRDGEKIGERIDVEALRAGDCIQFTSTGNYVDRYGSLDLWQLTKLEITAVVSPCFDGGGSSAPLYDAEVVSVGEDGTRQTVRSGYDFNSRTISLPEIVIRLDKGARPDFRTSEVTTGSLRPGDIWVDSNKMYEVLARREHNYPQYVLTVREVGTDQDVEISVDASWNTRRVLLEDRSEQPAGKSAPWRDLEEQRVEPQQHNVEAEPVAEPQLPIEVTPIAKRGRRIDPQQGLLF